MAYFEASSSRPEHSTQRTLPGRRAKNIRTNNEGNHGSAIASGSLEALDELLDLPDLNLFPGQENIPISILESRREQATWDAHIEHRGLRLRQRGAHWRSPSEAAVAGEKNTEGHHHTARAGRSLGRQRVKWRRGKMEKQPHTYVLLGLALRLLFAHCDGIGRG